MTAIKKLIILILVFSCTQALARIKGISTRNQLLQQLQISLNTNIADLNLPQTLVSKLPLANDLTLVKASFFSAWRQITFNACSDALAVGNISIDLNDRQSFARDLENLSLTSWGESIQDHETQFFWEIAANQSGTEDSIINRKSLVCSSLLSSPKVYLIKD